MHSNKTLNLIIRLVIMIAFIPSTTHYTTNMNKKQLSLTNMKHLKHLLVIQ